MPRRRRNFNQSFEIHVDQSCLSESESMEHASPSSIDEEQHKQHQQQPDMKDLVDIVDGELREQRELLQGEEQNGEDCSGSQIHDVQHKSNYERPSVVSDTHEGEEESFVEQGEHEMSIVDSDHSCTDEHAENQSLVVEEEQQEDNQFDTAHSAEAEEENADRSLHIEEEADIHDFADESSERLSNVSIRSHRSSPRRASKRTEALIHAAAKDIVAKIGHERHDHSDDKDGAEDSPCLPQKGQDQHQALDAGLLYPQDSDDSQFLEPQPDEQEGSAGENHVIKSVETDDAFLTEEPSFAVSSHRESDAHMSVSSDADNQSTATVEVHDEHYYGEEEGGDSSSHHDGDDQDEDDVFSDHSPRSSVGSLSDEQQPKRHADALSQKSRAPRVSDISHYDHDEEFVPTVRTTPRPAFRSPSSVKAIQMSSPPASVLGSPRSRSSRRTPMQGVSSRIGSPNLQYSPKKTPPRFRKATPPLVLLHVTIVQLSWPWGETLDNAPSTDLSQEAKNLKESWRLLQDRAGATVLERGILLAHPQGDYEILEERILDGLELPMRRRARILECGHYLGPSNEDTLVSETEPESEDDYYDNLASPRSSVARSSMARSRKQSTGFTYCTTCKSEIKYDALGKERIFRVKVYASNGLMRAGAWEACWKEMERVDVEVEPVISTEVQEELQRLAEEQAKITNIQDTPHSDDVEQAREMSNMEEMGDETFLEQVRAEEEAHRQMMASSPPPEIRIDTSPIYDDPRRMNEERLREIYGDSAPTASSPVRDYSPQPDDRASEYPSSPPVRYLEVNSQRQTRSPKPRYKDSPEPRYQDSPQPSQRSSPEANGSFTGRDTSGRRPANAGRGPAQEEALWKLLVSAGRIYFQDTKNLVIGILGLAVLMFAIRSGGNGARSEEFQTLVTKDNRHSSGVKDETTLNTVEAVELPLMEAPQAGIPTSSIEISSDDVQTSIDPCASRSSSIAGDAQRASQAVLETLSEVVRVIETVTETAYATEVVVVTSTVADSEAMPTSSAPADDKYRENEEVDASLASEETELEMDNEAVSGDDEV